MPQIQYSEKYFDDTYEYRCVSLVFVGGRLNSHFTFVGMLGSVFLRVLGANWG